ncbi:MAG: flagellar filament capping protein FliD [Clostridium sp.]|nr:flagellar filament capping protein FliD [Clostridium sp.]
MAGVRMTGLASGLDTESLVKQLSDAYQTKVDNAKKKQTKAEWKKEAWASLNTKLMDFYKGALNTFKSAGTYNSKLVNGTLNGVKVTANSKAVSGNHKIQVKSTANAQMWTGHKINTGTYTASSYTAITDTSKKISELYDKNGYSIQNALNGSSFTVQNAEDGSKVDVNINIDENTTVDDLLQDINTQLDGTGLKASMTQGRLTFTNETATETTDPATGTATYSGGRSLMITAANETSAKALGLTYDASGKGMTVKSKSEISGNEVNTVSGSAFAYDKQVTADSKVTGSSKLVDLGIAQGTSIKVNGTEIVVDRTTTMDSLASAMAKTGINASYDTNQGRFYLSSKNTGVENAFTVEADDATLAALGLNLTDGEAGKIDASDASLVYNGVEYTQATNSFNINGLTMDVSSVGGEQAFSVDTDVDGIYDKVKSFVKEYNTLITEMNKLYDASSSRGYEPLTSDEKDAMTDEDIKNWEDKIKGSLLRRDSTISTLLTSMRTTLNKSVEVTNSDGTTSRYALSSFGIVTSDYTEKGQLHIQGNADDSDFASLDDKLKAAISDNPEALMKTLTTLGNEIYKNFQSSMKRVVGVKSSLTFYNDLEMDDDIKSYKKDVTSLQEKLQDEQDKYYKQFSSMETALTKLQSQQTYISQLFGGS